MREDVKGLLAGIGLLVVLTLLTYHHHHYQAPAPRVHTPEVQHTSVTQVDDWDPFMEHTPPPLIPPVGPAWVTGVGTGGIGVIA